MPTCWSALRVSLRASRMGATRSEPAGSTELQQRMALVEHCEFDRLGTAVAEPKKSARARAATEVKARMASA